MDWVLMKRKKLALTLVLALLCSAMAGVNLTNLAEANPSHKQIGVVPPDAETKSPTITIISPHNGTTYDVDNVNFMKQTGYQTKPIRSNTDLQTRLS
jgi:ABC-type sugar transport system substrate-binding protein